MEKKSLGSRLLSNQKYIVLVVFVVLYILFFIGSVPFRKYTTLIQLLDTSYYFVFMGIGVSFALITGGVDLSIGTGMVCYALAGGYLVRQGVLPVWGGLLVAVLFGLAIGTLNGVLVSLMELPPFLATLCTCMITRGLGSICAAYSAVPWPTGKQPGAGFHNMWTISYVAEGGKKMNIPMGVIWVVLACLIMMFVLNHTRFGRYAIAIGSNKEATRLSGVNVKLYHVLAYTVCGLFAGLAAIPYASKIPTIQPGTGAGMELDAIGGAILGGMSTTGGYGSIEGTVIGVYVICLLKIGLPFVGLQANWQQVITGFILIGAVLIDIVKRRGEIKTA